MAIRNTKPIRSTEIKSEEAKKNKASGRIQTAEGWKRSQNNRRKLAK